MKETRFYFALRIACPTVFSTFCAAVANAQHVDVTGQNARITNGCAVQDMPLPCPSQIMTVENPFSHKISWNLPTLHTNGIAIGTNMTNSSSGLPASGGVSVTDGATVSSAYVYLGYEQNTKGYLKISGTSSRWDSASAGIVGRYGYGNLQVLDGGTYSQSNSDHFYIGYASTGEGDVLVRGVDANGNRSVLDVRNRIVAGNYGQGSLRIEDGAYVTGSFTTFVGTETGSNGSIIVDGVNASTGFRSTLAMRNNSLQIGVEGTGSVSILNGGLVLVPQITQIGGNPTGKGSVTVDGVHAATGDRSTLEMTGLRLADFGQGALNISNGALVQVSADAYIGRFAGGDGTINIDGLDAASEHRSSLTTDKLFLGYLSQGNLNVSGGGEVSSHSSISVGKEATGAGKVYVAGTDSSIRTQGPAYIGEAGVGTLTLVQGGSFDASLIELATLATGVGTLNIGQGEQSGVLNTATVTGGPGKAVVNFDHTDDAQFMPQLSGNLSVNKMGAGRATLLASNDYIGDTVIKAGTLAAGGVNHLSPNSALRVDAGSTLALQGYQQAVPRIEHAGMLDFGGSGGTVLNVTGDYLGNEGTLSLNTVLSNDRSVTDRLIVDGDTSGHSKLTVRNRNGLGSVTTEGIEVIRVQGASNGMFKLVGDYALENGKDVVVGGAYAYQLSQGNQSGTETKHWYLHSKLAPTPPEPEPKPGPKPEPEPDKPLYQAGVPLYEAYPQFLLAMNELPTLQQRVGNRSWGQSAAGDATARIEAQADSDATSQIEDNGIWARMEGGHTKIAPGFSTSSTDYRYDIFRMQLGYDNVVYKNTQGKLVGGINSHYVQGKARVASIYGDGDIKATGFGVGGTLTWYGNNDLYVDNQLQMTWYDADLNSKTAQRSMADGNKGLGYALSTELGKQIRLNDNWSITPQVQLVYSNTRFDAFDDAFNARVSKKKADSLQARIGLGANYQHTWVGKSGKVNRSMVYGLVNLSNEFLDGTKVDVSGTQFGNKQERVWASIGFGASYTWNDDKYALYGEATARTSLKNFGDSHGYKGSLGFRVRW